MSKFALAAVATAALGAAATSPANPNFAHVLTEASEKTLYSPV
jgi:hypothetical protein